MEFRVNRSIVRSAIRSLCDTGILTQQPNCRPVVAKSEAEATAEPRDPGRIAVWIRPDLQAFGELAVLRGIRSRLESSGYRMVVGMGADESAPGGELDANFLKDLLSQPAIAGVIVWETCDSDLGRICSALQESKLPLVFVDREPFEEIDADVVMTNNQRGARKAVEHLLSLGHRQIAMIANDEPASSARDRIHGYQDALREAMIDYRPELLLRVSAAELEKADRNEFAQIIRGLAALEAPPTALFCLNDGIAQKILQALEDCQVSVPEQVSVVGFDWALRSMPAGGEITTVAQPFEAIGRIAAERIIERIAGDVDPSRHIFLEAPLVVRSTSGPPPNHVFLTADLALPR